MTQAVAQQSKELAERFCEQDLVTLLVGPNEQRFVVHGSHLKSSSAFFTAALKKERLEGQERSIKLPEEDPRIFVRYIDFIYSRPLFEG